MDLLIPSFRRFATLMASAAVLHGPVMNDYSNNQTSWIFSTNFVRVLPALACFSKKKTKQMRFYCSHTSTSKYSDWLEALLDIIVLLCTGMVLLMRCENVQLRSSTTPVLFIDALVFLAVTLFFVLFLAVMPKKMPDWWMNLYYMNCSVTTLRLFVFCFSSQVK